MRKFEIIKDLEITAMGTEGKGIAKIDDKVVFIEGAIPGDVVDIRVRKIKKSFIEAEISSLKKKSAHRKDPFCEHFGICGGCKWQYIDYKKQIEFKRGRVLDNLQRIGKIDLPEVMPIVASEETEYYRNKLEFTFSNNRWLTKKEIESGEAMSRDALGFHIPRRFDKILQINHCYLQGSLSNEIRLSVDQYARENSLEYFDLNEQTGLLRNLLIRTSRTGDIMVIVQFAKNEEVIIQKLLEHIHKTFPTASSIMYVINTKKNDTFIDQEVLNYFGPGYINEIMIIPDSGRTLTFKIGPKSFFQTNSKQANILYNYVRELADIHEDEIVYDLYSGTGTIANFVADKAKKVVGLEYVADAIEDAKVNSQINGISNTSFHAGDMKKLLTDEFFKKHGSPQVIITDPPRAGMPEDVCRMILKARPKKIVYVSCNPSTQARDLMLFDSDYEVKKVIPVDMFPHTLHVENIILLILRE